MLEVVLGSSPRLGATEQLLWEVGYCCGHLRWQHALSQQPLLLLRGLFHSGLSGSSATIDEDKSLNALYDALGRGTVSCEDWPLLGHLCLKHICHQSKFV